MADILTVTLSPSIDVSVSAEKVVPGPKLRCTPAYRDPGGGGINVARVVRRLGGACRALYPAGGPYAGHLGHLLESEGIATLPIEIAADLRESFTVADQRNGNEYRFVLPGSRLEVHEWQSCLDRLASLRQAPRYLVASGSLPEGAPVDAYARITRIAAGFGARMVLDSSGPALAAALREPVCLVKPNIDELRELTGCALESESDWIEAAAEIVDRGQAELVALTLGDRGAVLVGREVRLRADGIPVKPVSSVGAGDSFLGAMVGRLADGRPIEDAFRWAVAAGTAALLTPGTRLCTRADTERLVREVVMREPESRRTSRA